MDMLYIARPKRICRVCAAFRTEPAVLNMVSADLLYRRRTPTELAREFKDEQHALRRGLTAPAFRSHARHVDAREVNPLYYTSPELFESGDSRRGLANAIERVVTGFYQEEQWRAVLGTADRLRLQAEALRREQRARHEEWLPKAEALDALARSLIRAHGLEELALEAGLSGVVPDDETEASSDTLLVMH